MPVVRSSEDVVDGLTGKNKDANHNQDWQIWPTSVNVAPTSDVSSSIQEVDDHVNAIV